jgi:hypothetical protein
MGILVKTDADSMAAIILTTLKPLSLACFRWHIDLAHVARGFTWRFQIHALLATRTSFLASSDTSPIQNMRLASP